jgi:long-chain-fatty-acid--CoA ligase ACSBG
MESLDFRVTDKTKRVKINMNSKDDIGTIEPMTIPQMFEKIVKKYPEHPALKQKHAITKDWETINYKSYKERVDKMAKVFIRLGLERQGTVGILAFNSVEWFVSELAAICAG